ncbi:hypothetical protein AT959_19930 [Dechloromonas denitrificans]|uniref:Uncharacterized protein n=1 Tax=Dechloromonas denitrificans TaxID=281362 RepID=A0A133XDR9_9RHOO|nr:hypothetical protein AT959_19930 [Dechloromonas denitrificans]
MTLVLYAAIVYKLCRSVVLGSRAVGGATFFGHSRQAFFRAIGVRNGRGSPFFVRADEQRPVMHVDQYFLTLGMALLQLAGMLVA